MANAASNRLQTKVVESLIDRLRTDLALSADEIVNPFVLARRLNIRVEFVSSTHQGARLIQNRRRCTIEMPQAASNSRKRFSCLHEIAHFLINFEITDLRDDIRNEVPDYLESTKIEEGICNRFAGEILVPSASIIRLLGQERLNMDRFHQIAQFYGASKWTTSIRIAQLSTDYAFVWAEIEKRGPREGRLAVSSTAAPSGYFLPRHKTIPETSCISTAWWSGIRIETWEEDPIGKHSRTMLISAAPHGDYGAFAILHLWTTDPVIRPQALQYHLASPSVRYGVEYQQLKLPSGG